MVPLVLTHGHMLRPLRLDLLQLVRLHSPEIDSALGLPAVSAARRTLQTTHPAADGAAKAAGAR